MEDFLHIHSRHVIDYIHKFIFSKWLQRVSSVLYIGIYLYVMLIRSQWTKKKQCMGCKTNKNIAFMCETKLNFRSATLSFYPLGEYCRLERICIQFYSTLFAIIRCVWALARICTRFICRIEFMQEKIENLLFKYIEE